MVDGDVLVHIGEILAVFLCVHHFWPKGITYGDREDWELKLEKKMQKAKNAVKKKAGTKDRGRSRAHSYSRAASDSGSGGRSDRSSPVSSHRRRRPGFYDAYYEPRSSRGGYDYEDSYARDRRHSYYESDHRRDRNGSEQPRRRREYSDDSSRGGSYYAASYADYYDRSPRAKYLEYEDGRSQISRDYYPEPRRHYRRGSSDY